MYATTPCLDFGKFGGTDNRVGLLQIPPARILVVVSAGMSLCITVSCTEVVATSGGRKRQVLETFSVLPLAELQLLKEMRCAQSTWLFFVPHYKPSFTYYWPFSRSKKDTKLFINYSISLSG